MSTISANDLQNTSGGIPTVKGQMLIPTAWVNFNGQNTVIINGAENVSSITDNGVGDYTANFTVSLVGTNYAITATSSSSTTDNTNVTYFLKTTGSVDVKTFRAHDNSQADSLDCSIVTMGGQ